MATNPTSTGIPEVDALSLNESPVLDDYIRAVSAYVRGAQSLSRGASKSAQIALSAGLGRCMKKDLVARLPRAHIHAGELTVAGALRPARADVSEAHQLDGLRIAVEIKPVNLAVGRAVWNRFGDVRAFAVNIHLKFPFAIVVGVIALPTWEWKQGKSASPEVVTPGDSEAQPIEDDLDPEPAAAPAPDGRTSTLHIIDRLVRRLQRSRRRETEADAAHLLEAVAVIAYDPDTSMVLRDVPAVGSGLRWDEVIATIAEMYELRFE
jgi:hypothetical protein